MKVIKRGIVEKPSGNKGGMAKEKIIQYGIRTPMSDFDHRPEVGSGPAYLGPSKRK